MLVIVNAFVGAMIGLERAILSQIAEKEFGLAVWTKENSNYWVAYSNPGSFSSNVGSELELDFSGQSFSWYKPRSYMVYDRNYEN